MSLLAAYRGAVASDLTTEFRQRLAAAIQRAANDIRATPDNRRIEPDKWFWAKSITDPDAALAMANRMALAVAVTAPIAGKLKERLDYTPAPPATATTVTTTGSGTRAATAPASVPDGPTDDELLDAVHSLIDQYAPAAV